eukprot:COSAG02_NODE_5436_length_4332_cov_5.473659_2_plen_75_part_00
MHTCSMPRSADGELSEVEVESIKQEMEDHIDEPLGDGEVAELTAEEMRMIMGEEKDDLRKILRVRARTWIPCLC